MRLSNLLGYLPAYEAARTTPKTALCVCHEDLSKRKKDKNGDHLLQFLTPLSLECFNAIKMNLFNLETAH